MRRIALLLGLVAAPLHAETPVVVTDIPVTQGLVAAVTGAPPEVILGAGEDPHHAALRPSQARLVSGADLAVTVGGGLSPAMARALDALAHDAVLDLSQVEGVRGVESHEGEDHAGEPGDHNHDHDHGGGDHGEAGSHDDHGAEMHAWLDPSNAVLWLDAIAERLARADPDGDYVATAAQARARVEAAADDAATRIAAADVGLLAAHDAWGGAVAGLGLNVVGAISDSEARAPGARRMASLAGEVAEVDCLLVAPGDDARLARRVAEEAGLPIVTVPILGDPEIAPEARYPALLDAMARAAEDCRAATAASP